MAKNGGDWWLKAVTAGQKRASQRQPDFYERYVGEVARPRPGLAPVRWLDARPSAFWNLSEREFAAALAARQLLQGSAADPALPALGAAESRK
jgi:hypothetical protein